MRLVGEILPGETWLVHGWTLYALRNHDGALDAALRAEQVFNVSPTLALDRADAMRLRARIWCVTGRTAEALEVMEECLDVYDAHGDVDGCVRVFTDMGVTLSLHRAWHNAGAMFDAASRLAVQIGDAQLNAELEATIANCLALRMPRP